MSSNSTDPSSSAFRPLDATAFPPLDETYASPPSYQQLGNMATAPPLADDHASSPASLRVPDPSAPPPSYEEAVGPVDKAAHGEDSKPFSADGGYSSIDDQTYSPRFKNEPRTWESDPSTVITNTQPGVSSTRTTNQGMTCTDEDCKTCCEVCIICLYCCQCLLEILSAFK